MSISRLFVLAGVLVAAPAAGQTYTRITQGTIVSDGGVSFGHSWGDFDGDGWQDLLVNNIVPSESNLFYRNRQDGTFERVFLVAAQGPSVSSTWGDFNNDGQIDFFVANGGTAGNFANYLFAGAGSGTFNPITTGAHVEQQGLHTAATWMDVDNDGWLDLFVGRANGPNRMFFNQGDGTFIPRSLPDVGGTWGVSASDTDGDGDLDFYAANWNTPNYYYRNDHGVFARVNGVIADLAEASVSASWGDIDNDGDPDLFVANVGARNRLFLNRGDGLFDEVTEGRIVTDVWNSESSCFGDIDNDGDLDLIVSAGGNISVGINRMYINDGTGTFQQRVTGDLVFRSGRYEGLSCVDYDNDGDLDVFISNYLGLDNELYRNDGPVGNWLTVSVVGVMSNRTGIGARVRVRAQINGTEVWQMREVSGQTGHVAQGDQRSHFGLGTATQADSVVVEWPSGQVDSYGVVPGGQFVTATEGTGMTGITVSVDEAPDLPGFNAAVFPNPFSGSGVLELELSQAESVLVEAFDLLGRRVAVVAETFLAAGRHQLSLDGVTIPPGRHYLRVTGKSSGVKDGLMLIRR